MKTPKQGSDLMASIFGSGHDNQEESINSFDLPKKRKTKITSIPGPSTTNAKSLFENGPSPSQWKHKVQRRRDANARSLKEQLKSEKARTPDGTQSRPKKLSGQLTNRSVSMAPKEVQASLEDIVVDIPPEIGQRIGDTGILDAYEDALETQRGVQRLFTRQSDFVLREYGVVLLRRNDRPASDDSGAGKVFPRKLIKKMRDSTRVIEEQVIQRLDAAGKVWDSTSAASTNETEDLNFSYYEVASRCLGRLDIRHGMDQPPFHTPDVIDNPGLMPLIRSLLGDSAKLVYCGLILSFPGSDDQPWHQDGHALFPEAAENDSLGTDLPPYALNVFVPLTTIDESLGPTEFWLASHKESQLKTVQSTLRENEGSPPTGDKSIVRPLLGKGDVLIYDYRACHRGTANTSEKKVRPMLYLMYARPWFAEHVNFGSERLFPQDCIPKTGPLPSKREKSSERSPKQESRRKKAKV